MISAKIKLQGKNENNDQVTLTFVPDYADDRNKEWAKYTPALSLSLSVLPEVAERFEEGAAYTLLFEKSE